MDPFHGIDPDELARKQALAADMTSGAWSRMAACGWLVERGLACDWPPPVPEQPPSPILDSEGRPYTSGKPLEKRKPRLITSLIDDIEEEEEDFLWPGRIPLGTLTLLMGRMGDGKSTFVSWLASTVSTGAPWPDSPDDNEPGSVLILQAEESSSRAIKPRLASFGYGAGKIRIIKGVDRGDGRESWFSLAGDVESMADECRRLGDVRLIVVDPLGSYIRGISGYNESETRTYLQPLFSLAEEFGLAVLAVAHPNKDGEKDILDRVSGSGAIIQMARMAWYLSVDPNDRSRRLLSLMKGNMLGAVRTGIAVHYDARKRRITWFADPVDLDARQVDHLLQRAAREAKLKARPGPDPKQSARAEKFILELVEKAPCLLTTAEDLALNVGIKGSTFRRALRRLLQSDGRVRKETGKEDGKLWLTWVVPQGGPAPGPSGEGEGGAEKTAPEGPEQP